MKNLTLEEFLTLHPCKTYRNLEEISRHFENGKTKDLNNLDIPSKDKLWLFLKLNPDEELRDLLLSHMPRDERFSISDLPLEKIASRVLRYWEKCGMNIEPLARLILEESEAAIG